MYKPRSWEQARYSHVLIKKCAMQKIIIIIIFFFFFFFFELTKLYNFLLFLYNKY